MSPRESPRWAASLHSLFLAYVSIYLCIHSAVPHPHLGPSWACSALPRGVCREGRGSGKRQVCPALCMPEPGGIPWGSWQPGRRRKVTGSYHSQSLLLLEFPGPHLSPFGMLLTCLCGQNRVEGLPYPAPPAFQALAPAALSCLPDPHSGPHPSGPFPQSSSPQSPALLPHATQLSPSGAEHF